MISGAARYLMGAAGLGIAGYGALLLCNLGPENLFETAIWLLGGVALHDAVIGPAAIVLAGVGTFLAHGRVPAPVIVGAIVLSTVTLTAVPVLGRFGARADNPTLLPRDYLVGWLLFATIVSISVASALAVGRRSTKAR